MKILIACEYSGIVRDAFIAKGHDAISCDILPTEQPGPHHQGLLEDYIGEGSERDMIIGFPPCTYMCNSGVRWLHTEDGRWEKLNYATAFFNMIKNRNCEKIIIENPIPHKYARKEIGKYSQIIQPWQFGHGEQKATCLWLKGVPELVPTDIVEGREQRVWKMGRSETRSKNRSKTLQGIADAMANQWG